MSSFRFCGWREIGGFLMGSYLERLKDMWLKTLFFCKEEVSCSSSLDIVDFVDSLWGGGRT